MPAGDENSTVEPAPMPGLFASRESLRGSRHSLSSSRRQSFEDEGLSEEGRLQLLKMKLDAEKEMQEKAIQAEERRLQAEDRKLQAEREMQERMIQADREAREVEERKLQAEREMQEK